MYFGAVKLRHATGGRLVYGVRDSFRLPRLLFEKFGGWEDDLSGSATMQEPTG